MPKKLTIDSLSSEITTLSELYDGAKVSGDIVGEIQLSHRLNELKEKLSSLQSSSFKDNNASVALFFGGRPVLGSKGIAAEFAGLALEQFQDLISKTFAITEVGQLGERGKIPLKAQSELMITGLAKGSFGFILDEMTEQTQLEASELTHIIDKVTLLLRDTAAEDDAIFESIVEDLDPRTLVSLKELFANLELNQATMRVVEKDRDILLDNSAIHRGKIRTEATTIEEKSIDIEGVLVGFLPEHRKFEIKDSSGDLIYGSATREAVEQFEKASESVIGNNCLASIVVKTISPLNRPARDVFRLIEFLQFE